jgi:hypothetical protein
MSGGRVAASQPSTIVRVRTSDEGWDYHSLPASSIARFPADDPYILKAVWRAAVARVGAS